MTKRHPKFRPGPPIRRLSAVVALIEQGQWFYWPSSARPISPKWLANMSVAVLRGAAINGRLRLAIPYDEAPHA